MAALKRTYAGFGLAGLVVSLFLKNHFPDEMLDCFFQPPGDAMDGALHMSRSAYINRK